MSSVHQPRGKRPHGFTLIELIVTISIMAVLAAIAFPSFSYSLRNNRIGTQTNDFLSALNYARNEAVSRSRGVSICAADTSSGVPGECGAADDWTTGWMVFVDDTVGGAAPGPVDATKVLRTGQGNAKNEVEPEDGQAFIRFNPRGQAVADVTPVVFVLKPATDCSNDQQRRITVSALGRSGSSKEECT
jgi:type IV fimbrial biogenesis protein FimT